MCFSATASFGASAILLTIGVIAIKKSANRSERLLACIPLIFCVQQFAEGFVWLGASYPEFYYLKKPATYTFLIFAQVVLPVMVPLSMLQLEKKPAIRKIQRVLLGIGVLISLYLSYCLLFYNVNANIECYHIRYDLDFPLTIIPNSGIFYFIPAVIPPIVSSVKRLRILGSAILLSYIITQIFYKEYLISVWCFFAAIISVLVLFTIIDLNRTKLKYANLQVV